MRRKRGLFSGHLSFFLALPQTWTPLRIRVKRLSAADTRSVSPRVTRELCASTARSLSTGEREARRRELSKVSQ